MWSLLSVISVVMFFFQTIVTSTTLTGKKQQLEAHAGDKYQVDVLSNAEAWIPTSNPDNTANNSILQSLHTQLVTGITVMFVIRLGWCSITSLDLFCHNY